MDPKYDQMLMRFVKKFVKIYYPTGFSIKKLKCKVVCNKDSSNYINFYSHEKNWFIIYQLTRFVTKTLQKPLNAM